MHAFVDGGGRRIDAMESLSLSDPRFAVRVRVGVGVHNCIVMHVITCTASWVERSPSRSMGLTDICSEVALVWFHMSGRRSRRPHNGILYSDGIDRIS